MAFDFPDPSVSKNVTNPLTGASYQWYDDPGKWVLVRANVTSKEAFTRFYAAEDPAAYDETVDGTCALIATGTTIDTITGIKLSEDDLKGKVRYLYEVGEKVVIEDGRNGAYALLEITAVNGDGDYDVKLDKENGQSDIDLTEIYAFGVLQADTTFRGAILDSTEPTEHPDFVAPDNALILGDLWYDTTDAAEYIPYVFDGSAWVLVSADRMPIVSGSAPTEHPKFPGQPLVEGDLWLDNSSGGQMAIYAWDETNNSWTAVGDAGRPPIFSPTEPTEHPDFSPPDNQLQIGDEWYDTSNPDEIVQHIYDGTDWLAIGGDYVHRKGGDSMQGPLQITGERNADPNTGVQSLIKVLNVDSGQNSSLQLKHNGTAKIYIGSGQTSFQHDIKFAQDNKQVYSGSDTDKKGLSFHSDGVEYHGNYTKDDHVATKKDVEEAVFDDPTNPDSNKYVDRTGDTMTGDLTLDDSIVRFENRGDGEPMIRAYRQDGEYPMLMDLRHPGGANNGGYDIKIQGNTSYNSLRFVGADTYLSILAGGGAPYKVRFHTDISMEGSKIAKLAEATDDTDAVPYGQIKTELQEKFEEITATLSFGDFSFVATSAARGLGVLTSFTTASSTTVERDPASVGSLGVHHVAGDGSAVGWDSLNPGDIIRWTRGTDVWQFRVNGAPQPEDSGDELWYRIPVNQGSGPNFVDSGIGNFDYTLSLLKLTGGSADLTDYVKKAGDTMTGELKIQQGSEAKLTLQGNRNNITNSVATVSFLNTSASGQAGYLTYRSDGTNSPFFKFNENLDLNSKQLKNLSSVNFGNVGTIKANDNNKIVVRNAGNGNQGNANVQIERPPSGRRGFAIRGQTPDGGDDTDIFWSYTNASDGDAVNYEGKMSNPTNILNRSEIEKLIAAATGGGGGGASGETFISHGPWHFAGVNSAVGSGQFTSNNGALKQIRQFTFHNKNTAGDDQSWSDLQPGEVITIVQQGNFSSVGGDADGWAIVNYEVTEVDAFSSATILNVSAHWSVLVFSSGFVQYNPNELFTFLEDTDTYVLESQPATLNNVVQMAKKTSAGPAYSVYKLSSGTSEPLLGVPKGNFICNNSLQNPNKFIFSADDHYGNGLKWGSNTINCPNSTLELYRKNADGTLCLCRIYRFDDVQHYGSGTKFEIRNITPLYTASGGTNDILSPGNMTAGENYLCRFKYSFGTTTSDLPEAIEDASPQKSTRAGLDDLVAPRLQIVSEDPNYKNSDMFEGCYAMFPGKDDYHHHHVDQRFILLARMYEGKKDPEGTTVNRETIDSNQYGNDDLPNLAIQDLKTGKIKPITTAVVTNEEGNGVAYPSMRGCHVIANDDGSCNAYLWIHNPMRTVRQSAFSNNACPLFRIFIPAEENINDSNPFANFVFKWTGIRCDKSNFTTPAVNPYTLRSDVDGSEKYQYEIQTQSFHLKDSRHNKRYIFMSYNKGISDYCTQRLFEVKFSKSDPDDGMILPIEAHPDSDNGSYSAGFPAIKKTIDGDTKCFLFGTPTGLTHLYFVPDGSDEKLQLRNYSDYIPMGTRVLHPTEVNDIGQPLITSKGIYDNWYKMSATQPQWLTEGLWDENNPFSTRLIYFQSGYGIVSIPTEDLGNKADQVKLENNFKGDINAMHIETNSNTYMSYNQESSTKNLCRFSTHLVDTRSNGSVWFFDYKPDYLADNTSWYNDTREYDNNGNVTFKYEFKRGIIEVRPNLTKGNIEIIGHSVGRRRSDNGMEEGNVSDFSGESICKMYDQFVCVGAYASHSKITKARVHIFDPFTKNISLVSNTEVNASDCVAVPQRGLVALSDYGIDSNGDPTTMYYISMLAHTQDTINIRKSASVLRTLYSLTGTDVETAEDTWTLDAPVAPGISENRSEPESEWDNPGI